MTEHYRLSVKVSQTNIHSSSRKQAVYFVSFVGVPCTLNIIIITIPQRFFLLSFHGLS